MRTAVMQEVRKIIMEERPMPQAGPGEVLIRVSHCGICGSDIHYYEQGRVGDFVVEKPIILGHECAGVVVDTGENVTRVKKGEVVAVEPGRTCGKCEFCKSGRYNLCPDVRFLATPPYDGAFAEYIAYPEDMVFPLPASMDTVEGAMLEPFCVGLHAAMQSECRPGQSAAVLGAGCIGLCTMLALSVMGVKEVYVADRIGKRLQMAGELGATAVVDAGEKDTVEEILKMTGGRGVDLVFETAGAEQTLQQTASLVATGGTVVLVGMAADPVFRYDFGKIMSKEVKLHTVFRYRNLYPLAIKAVSEQKVPLKKIVTDFYPFEKTAEAMEDSVQRKADIVKAVIEFAKI